MNAGRHALDQTIDRALANAPPLLPQQIFESREIIAGEKQSAHTALQQAPHVLNGIEIWRPSRPAQGSDARLGFVRVRNRTPVTCGIVVHQQPVSGRITKLE